MNRAAAVITAALGCALVVLSAFCAYRFGEILGVTPQDSILLGAIGVALGVTKAFLPFSLAAAWKTRKPVLGALAFAALAACVASSMAGAIGLNSAQRASIEVFTETPHRPPSVIKPLLEAARGKERAALQSEYNEAVRPKAPSASAQIIDLARLTNSKPDNVRTALVLLFAVALELGELLCFYSAATMWTRPEKAKEPVPAEQPRCIQLDIASSPAPATTVESPSEARFSVAAWLDGHLATSASNNAAAVYSAYLEERKKARRKPLTQSAFNAHLSKALLRSDRGPGSGLRLVRGGMKSAA